MSDIENKKSIRQIVEAGAGCGKTTGLVARYRAAIGCPDKSEYAPKLDPRYTRTSFHPNEVLALTFTNEAAEQMKDRIVRSLEKDGEHATAQRVLEDSQICTYHSFCLRLIQPHLEQLGYQSSLLSPEIAKLYRRKDLMRAFADFPEAHNLRKFLSLEDCIELAANFLTDSSFSNNIERFSPEASVQWHKHVQTTFESFKEQHLGEAHRKRLQLKNTNWIEKWIAALESDQSNEISSLRFSLPKEPEILSSSFVNAAKDLKAFYKEGFRDSLREENLGLESEALKIFQDFINFAQDYIGKYLDFDSVEQELHALLQKDPRALIEAPKLILVDEFQDTSPQQFAIIQSLSAPETQWYFVGDPKQSIYAFRKSDVSLFYQMREKLELIQFDTNYRSDASILNLVNHIQADIFDPSKDALDPPAQHLNFPESKSAEENLGEVQVFELGKKADPLQLAAEKLPEFLHAHQEDSIAVLFRSWKKLYLFAQMLRTQGQAFEIAGSENPLDHILTELFCDFLEYKELFARSGSEDLKNSKWLAAKQMWGREALSDTSGPARLNIEHPGVDSNSKNLIQSTLGDWQQLLVEFSEHIDLGCFEKSDSWSSCLSRWLNEQAKLGLIEILSPLKLAFFLKKHTKDIKLKSPYPAPATQVTLMTLHASKGLEFDHVLLPELFERASSRSQKSIESEEGETVVSFDLKDKKGQTLKSLRHSGQKLVEKSKKYAEEKRLLYVALTRAKSRLSIFARETNASTTEKYDGDALKVLGFQKPKPAYWNSLISELPRLDGVSSIRLQDANDTVVDGKDSPVEENPKEQAPQKWNWPKQSRLARLNTDPFLRLGVSSYLARNEEKPSYQAFASKSESTTSSSELGNAFHALIEKTRPDPNWLTENVDTASYCKKTLGTLSRLSFPIEEEEKLHICKALLNVYQLPELQELWKDSLVSPEKVQREFGLFVISDKYRLTGFADLIHFKSADELILIDWKTSRRLSTLKKPERIEKFREQLKVYADAFSNSYKNISGLIVGIELSDTPKSKILLNESLI